MFVTVTQVNFLTDTKETHFQDSDLERNTFQRKKKERKRRKKREKEERRELLLLSDFIPSADSCFMRLKNQNFHNFGTLLSEL